MNPNITCKLVIVLYSCNAKMNMKIIHPKIYSGETTIPIHLKYKESFSDLDVSLLNLKKIR